MKKLVSIFIITTLLMTAFVLPVNATDIDYRYGDVNMDGDLNVLDSTAILCHCAKVVELKHIAGALADFDNDSRITVMDATSIQMYKAKLVEHPRNEEWLEYYVEIEDLDIGFENELQLTHSTVNFTPVFDEIYNTTGDKKVVSKYVFKGITDETFEVSYPEIGYQDGVSMHRSFSEPGVYEVTVYVAKEYEFGTYSFTKQFEILPRIEFDAKLFTDYSDYSNYWDDYPRPPEDASEVDYEIVLNSSAMHLDNSYGSVLRSERCVALIHTKYEYDRFFGVNNTKFDDEFFATKSLVVALSRGNEYYDYSKIHNIIMKDDVLYVGVAYGNNSPYEGIQLPLAPMWYSFASVDKADVEHIESVRRY